MTRSTRKKICINFDKTDASFQSCVVHSLYSPADKVNETNKTRKLAAARQRETRSGYPLRKNIWEYLNEDKNVNFGSSKRKTRPCKQTKAVENNKMWAVLLLILAGVVMMSYSRMSDFITQSRFITKVVPKTRLISLLNIEQSVDQECCHVIKSLAASLLKAEMALRNTQRIRRLMITSRASKTDVAGPYERDYISDAAVMRGSDTREWGARVALWGLVPLWRAAPPPATVLATRNPVPADCWPFSGSQGEIIIELKQETEVRCISIEHVRPDTAKSAPKNFVLYGVLENGTWIKSIEAEYRNHGPAKQFFEVTNNTTLQKMVLRIMSNQGNPEYTCVYRVHLYKNMD